MAFSQFRLQTQGVNADKQQKLSNILAKLPEVARNQILESIDRSGTFDPNVLKQYGANPQEISDFQGIVGELPSLKDSLQEALSGKVDTAGLTDQEIQDRISEFGKYSDILSATPAQIKQKRDELRDKFVSYFDKSKQGEIRVSGDNTVANDFNGWVTRQPQGNLNSIAEQAADSIAVGNEDPVQVFGKFGLGQQPTNALIGKIGDLGQYQLNNAQQLSQVGAQTKTLKDLLGTRQKQAADIATADQSTASLPAQLGAATDQYIGGLRNVAGASLGQELAPQAIENLNLRGLVDSGDLPSELARAYSQAYAPVESEQATLMAQDQAFFQNAGYNDALRKAIASGQDVTSAIADQQGNARQEQGNNFAASENRLNASTQDAAFRRAQERAAAIAANRASIAAEQASKAKSRGLASSLGSASSIAGGALLATGNPAGLALIGGGVAAGGLFG